MQNSKQVTLFTTFNAAGYAEYGKKMLQSFADKIPQDSRIVCYTDGFMPDFWHENIEYRDLNACSKALATFKLKFGQFEMARGIIRQQDGTLLYNYNFDAIKFCHKVYCITHALLNIDTRYAFWLDGDTVCKKPIPQGFFQSFLKNGEYTCYLGRNHMHSECGFVGYDTQHGAHKTFVNTYESIFNHGDIFALAAWHDCVAYDELRKAFERVNHITSNNISAHCADTMHVFVNTPLGEYMDHLKGPQRKAAGSSFDGDYLAGQIQPGQPSTVVPTKPAQQRNRTIAEADKPVGTTSGRYAQINSLLAKIKPRSIAEIGTWNGYRALEMAKEALKHQDQVTYYGFDLFEQATDDTDSEEMNVKPHYTKELVSKFLDNFKQKNPGFNYVLTAGNTRETLKPLAVDFAFIDGGHSIETILGDYEALKDSKFILFDDYYEGGIDIEKYGCNKIVEKLHHTVLPIGDPVAGGGITKFVVVEN